MTKNLFLDKRIKREKQTLDRLMSWREWTAACMLAGSLCEALLLRALKGLESGVLKAAIKSVAAERGDHAFPRRKLNRFMTSDFAYVSEAAGIISTSTRDSMLSFCRHRALIHAGVAVRQEQEPTEWMALHAASVVALIEREAESVGALTDVVALVGAM